METPVQPITTAEGTIVGQYFHTFRMEEDGCRLVQYQGQIETRISETVYMVQLNEWFVGSPSTRYLATLEEMVRDRWEFYQTAEAWNETFQHNYEYQRTSHLQYHIEPKPAP
jgi:hypothetical protein